MDEHKNGDPMDQAMVTYTNLPSVKIQEHKEKAHALDKVLESFIIASAEDADQLGGLLGSVHKEIKDLDTVRLEVGKPAREAQKDINDFFKPALDGYKEVKTKIKTLLSAYEAEKRREHDESIAKASVGEADAIMEPMAPIAGTKTQQRLQIEITDFDKIPRDYLCVDYSALKILAKNGGDSPPGVLFNYIQDIMVGGK